MWLPLAIPLSITFCFVLLAINIFAELIVIRTPEKNPNIYCISNNDGILFNDYDLPNTCTSYSENFSSGVTLRETLNVDKFFRVYGNSNDTGNAWNVGNSVEQPIDNVREFKGQDCFQHKRPFSFSKESGTLTIFSNRSLLTLEIHFARDNKNFSCGSIVFLASNKTPQIIGSCSNNQTYEPSKNTTDQLKNKSPVRWHAYAIRWNSKEIQAFNQNTKMGSRTALHHKARIVKMNVVNVNENEVFFNGHKYIYTKVGNVSIHIQHDSYSDNSCISMLISLCSECQYNLTYNGNSKLVENQGVVNSISKRSTFLTNVKFEQKFITIKVTTLRKNKFVKGYWAIHSISQCLSLGSPQQIAKNFNFSENLPKKIITKKQSFPNFCQTLSITGNSTINYNDTSLFTNVTSEELNKCLRGTGPLCDFQCNESCEGTSICTRAGCICAPGFGSLNCSEKCPNGSYGYSCRGMCDYCNSKECDPRSGQCTNGCQIHYLPPYCEKKLEPPNFLLPDPVEKKYLVNFETSAGKYVCFQIKKKGGEWKTLINGLAKINEWKWSHSKIEELESKTEYNLRVILNETISPEISFDTTKWSPYMPENITTDYKGFGIVDLTWDHCQISWLTIKNFQINMIVLETRLSKPCKLNETELYLVNNQQRTYKTQIKLPTASTVEIQIKAISDNNISSKPFSKKFTVPVSIEFASNEEFQVERKERSLIVRIPTIVNDTNESIIKLIVYKPSTIQNLDLINCTKEPDNEINCMKNYTGAMKELKNFTISEKDGCSFLNNETYRVMLIIEDQISNKTCCCMRSVPNSQPFTFIWVVMFLACFTVLPLLYLVYRCRQCIPHMKLKSSIFIKFDNEVLGQSIDDFSTSQANELEELEKQTCFKDYVKKAAENGLLERQFNLLPRGSVEPSKCKRLQKNKIKNRYENSIAYDNTQVILAKNFNDPSCDYINANFISGYCKENAYIATQGPLKETIVDFWRMIWQEKVLIICMLADIIENGTKMCEMYWPEKDEEQVYGNIVVTNINQRIFCDYTCRTFQVNKRNETECRIVEHLQYRAWQEIGIPQKLYSFMEYFKQLLSIPPGEGPIVVHCSSKITGTGRTGAVILTDICVRGVASGEIINVFEEAKKMFNARANMLHNYSQYAMAHLMAINYLLLPPTRVLCNNLSPEKIEEMKKDLPTHIEILKELFWTNSAIRPLAPLRPPLPENISKNRFRKYTPGGPNLVSLTRYPAYDSTSDYISAVSVDGVKMKNQYIASQLPMPTTRTDFWRLILEKNVELIIILQNPNPEDESCCDVISRGKTIIPVPYVKIESAPIPVIGEFYTTDKLVLIDTSKKEARTRNITVLTCKDWAAEENSKPPPPKALVNLWLASENIIRAEGPTLVLCYDGVTGCSLYIALSIILERMTVEKVCDVISAVRTICQSRPEFVCSQQQFEYLYDAALKYVEWFQIYANFT